MQAPLHWACQGQSFREAVRRTQASRSLGRAGVRMASMLRKPPSPPPARQLELQGQCQTLRGPCACSRGLMLMQGNISLIAWTPGCLLRRGSSHA